MQNNLNENSRLTNELIIRNKAILKGKHISLVKEFETKSIDHFFCQPYSYSKKNISTLKKKHIPSNFCFEFFKKFIEKSILPYFRKNGKINYRCLFSNFKRFEKFSFIVSISLDSFCYFLFFIYLWLQAQFLQSFYMIFEIVVALLIILGFLLKLIGKKSIYFLYLLTFVIPLIGYLIKTVPKLNLYLNFFRGLRFIKIAKIFNEIIKNIIKRNDFMILYEKIVDLLTLFMIFLVIGVSFCITKEMIDTEKTMDPSELLSLFVNYELLIFDCMNGIKCNDISLYGRDYEFEILIFFCCYFTFVFVIVFEIFSLIFTDKKISKEIWVYINPELSILRNLKIHQSISILGLPPYEFLFEMLSELNFQKKSKNYYNVNIFIDPTKIIETRVLISKLFEKYKYIKSCQIIVSNFKKPLLSEKLNILSISNYIFVYLKKNENNIINTFYMNMIQLHKFGDFNQKLYIFISTNNPRFKQIIPYEVCYEEKIKDYCIQNIILNPILASFLSDLSLKDKTQPLLKEIKLSSFFINKSFEECSKIIYYSAFYCNDIRNKLELNLHTMVISLGVIKKHFFEINGKMKFILNPSLYKIQQDDTILILTNDLDAVAYIENYNENNYKKYQQIIELMESSYQNFEELECSESEFFKNLNLIKTKKKNKLVVNCINLMKTNFPQKIEFENHLIFVSYKKSKRDDNLLNLITKIKEYNHKIEIVYFTNQENFEIFEQLNNFNCVSVYGDFLDEKHMNFLMIFKCKRLIILTDFYEEKSIDYFGNFLYLYFKEKFKCPNIFFQTNSPQALTPLLILQKDIHQEIFTSNFFYSLLSKYCLNDNIKLFLDGLINDNLGSNNIFCIFKLNENLASKFSTYGNFVWFLFKRNLSIIPLGISLKSYCFNRIKDKIYEKCKKGEFITNPELTLKLKKGNEILILMKKGLI